MEMTWEWWQSESEPEAQCGKSRCVWCCLTCCQKASHKPPQFYPLNKLKHSHKLKMNPLKINGSRCLFVEASCCTAILNTVTEMDIAVLPNRVLCLTEIVRDYFYLINLEYQCNISIFQWKHYMKRNGQNFRPPVCNFRSSNISNNDWKRSVQDDWTCIEALTVGSLAIKVPAFEKVSSPEHFFKRKYILELYLNSRSVAEWL